MTRNTPPQIAVLGAGLAGCTAALKLARTGFAVDLFDRAALPMSGASLHNEGKLHLGYVYAADPEEKTYRAMVRGSLAFLPILAELTGVDAAALTASRAFHYGVPHDSMVPPDAVAAHFANVDAEIAGANAAHGYAAGPPGSSRRLRKAEFNGAFRRDTLSALFATEERAVDTIEIADIVSAAVAAESAIRLRLSTEIEGAEERSDGSYGLSSRTDGEKKADVYPAVINALWDDRVRIDAQLGITPPRPVLARFKATLNTRRAPRAIARTLPSLTLISGPFGDIVNYGGGAVYLSWYPACKLGQADGADTRALREGASQGLSCEALLTGTLEALGRYVDGVGALAEGGGFVAGGGMVMADGEADIDDPDSGLHQRFAIGPRLHGRWLSLGTGKYCTAPLFGKQSAEMLAAALG